MPETIRSAGLLLPAVLRIMRDIDASGDVAGGREVLRQFRRTNAPTYGQRAVSVAFAVARVRHARALADLEECNRIKAFLRTLEGDGDGPCAQS